MITKIKPIKCLDNLKKEIPKTLILIHKELDKAFTLIGKPKFYSSKKSLELEHYLFLSFVIDMQSTTCYEGISEMYSKHVCESFPESFIYNPNDFSKEAKVELYELINE